MPALSNVLPYLRAKAGCVEDCEGLRRLSGVSLHGEPITQLGGWVMLAQFTPVGQGEGAPLDVLLNANVGI